MEIRRPITMSSGKRGLATCVYLDQEMVEKMDEIRWREHKSRSELIRRAMEEYVRQHSDGNDTYKMEQWIKNPNMEAIPNLFAADEKHKKDYQSANKEERNKRFKQVQNILNIYKSVNYSDSHE